MPAQKRPRGNQTRPARQARQVTSGRRQQGAVSGPKLRPTDLAAKDLKFVAENHELDVLGIRATAAADQQAEQSPDSEVVEREEHAADPRSPQPEKTRPE